MRLKSIPAGGSCRCPVDDERAAGQAKPATPAPQAAPAAPAKYVPPIRGETEVNMTKPVTKRTGNGDHHHVQGEERVSDRVDCRLKVSEFWYDKRGIRSAVTNSVPEAADAGEVIDIELRSPINPKMATASTSSTGKRRGEAEGRREILKVRDACRGGSSRLREASVGKAGPPLSLYGGKISERGSECRERLRRRSLPPRDLLVTCTKRRGRVRSPSGEPGTVVPVPPRPPCSSVEERSSLLLNTTRPPSARASVAMSTCVAAGSADSRRPRQTA